MADWLKYYNDRHFTDERGAVKPSSIIPLPQVFLAQMKTKCYDIEDIKTPNEILNYNPSSVICLLPSEYFSPKSYTDGKVYCTDNTYCIHHFAGSWVPIEQRLEHKFWKFLGLKPHRIMWHVDLWLDKIKVLFAHRQQKMSL